MGKQPEEREQSVPIVKESNTIGADAGDATSGEPISPEEWAAEQPLIDAPTHPLDAGDPSPYEPSAGTPEAEEFAELEVQEEAAGRL